MEGEGGVTSNGSSGRDERARREVEAVLSEAKELLTKKRARRRDKDRLGHRRVKSDASAQLMKNASGSSGTKLSMLSNGVSADPPSSKTNVNRPQHDSEDVLEEETSVRVVQPDDSYACRTPNRQPLEIVVRHTEVVSQQNSEDEDDDTDIVFDGTERYADAQEDMPMRPIGRQQWRTNAGGNRVMMEVEDSDTAADADGPSRRHHHLRYRLIRSANDLEEDEFALGGDEDQLEVHMDEEEIDVPAGDGEHRARHIVKRFWEARWKVQHFDFLPDWMQDNEYLHTGHRPPLPSFGACFKSIFAVHTETGNIWTHMFGCVFFIGIAAWFLTQPTTSVQWQEKVVFSFFFAGAIACLGMSFAFHTVSCHSHGVVKLFSKLDYVGISLLIVGSFIPWLFYGFYCRFEPKVTYIAMVCVMGVAAVIVSLWDKFAEPKFRPIRAGVFVCMGLSGVIPAIHYMITDGFMSLFEDVSIHWLILMAFLYIGGAALYATRTPERFFPGKCDIWFQSHQLFHMCVVVAAFVHYHGISEMAVYRLSGGSCPEQNAKSSS